MTQERHERREGTKEGTDGPAARLRRIAWSALAMAALGALTQAGCSETTRYYQCQGDVQCAMAKACARQCEDEYGYDGTCRKFSDTAPAECRRFVDIPTQAQESRIRVKRDPFR
jgi:hypothetical protein